MIIKNSKNVPLCQIFTDPVTFAYLPAFGHHGLNLCSPVHLLGVPSQNGYIVVHSYVPHFL